VTEGSQARLNRVGSLQVQGAGAHAVLVEDEGIWLRLAFGRQGVAEVGRRVLEALAEAPVAVVGRVDVFGWRILAAALGQAALYGLDWSVESAAIDTSGYAEDSVDRPSLRPYVNQIGAASIATMDMLKARRYWLLLGPSVEGATGREPVACLDTEGFLLRPDATGEDVTDFRRDAYDIALAGALASSLFAAPIIAGIEQAGAPSAWLGLAPFLSAFNRKERFFLTAQATGLLTHGEIHGPSLPLSGPFRQRLGESIGIEVPEHAYAATDYHLSWLYAALAWWLGTSYPGQKGQWLPTLDPGGRTLVDGSQEDIDLLVCWRDDTQTHVVAVEAKAYGAWGNAQMTSKVSRLEAIRRLCDPQEVVLRLVLTGRNRPQKLLPGWPTWATDTDGAPTWIPLSAPGLRVATQRCNAEGHPDANATTWKMTGPSRT